MPLGEQIGSPVITHTCAEAVIYPSKTSDQQPTFKTTSNTECEKNKQKLYNDEQLPKNALSI